MKKNILIVEDEESIVSFIKNRLDSSIYNVDIATDGREAFELILKNNYDLVTLDLMLPHIGGFEICKFLRKKSFHTLVIIVSALDTQEFKLKGYEYGCDDYVPKPFSAKELSIKIKALLNRREQICSFEAKNLLGFILDEELKTIKLNSHTLALTPSEYLILSTLISNSKRVYSRSELAQLIYDNYFGEIDERGIDSHIYHIRKKIKIYEEKELIKTVRGMGYIINEN